jgi:hypothetical protein
LVEDARKRTKTWLDTYLRNASILKDNGTTQASYISAFGDPPYPYNRVFYEPKNQDLVWCIFPPNTEPLYDWDGSIYGYNEKVPIVIRTVTKQGITGPKILWQAEAELRWVSETYPLGSFRGLNRIGPANMDMGGQTIYGAEYVLSYERDTT